MENELDRKKNRAYEQILTTLRTVDEDATVQYVKNKIYSIRWCFRKELKNLLYFNNLMFLVDQETRLNTPIKNIVESDVFIPDDTLLSPPLFSEEKEASVMANTSRSAPSSSITSSSFKSGTKCKRDKANELLEKVSKTLDNKDDKFIIKERHTPPPLLTPIFYLLSHANDWQQFQSPVFKASLGGKWFIISKRRVEPNTDKRTKKNEVYGAYKTGIASGIYSGKGAGCARGNMCFRIMR
ncbi:hypothetical protein HHI36_007875 [Cryptolaemus montrouzieri]|uniref:Uncharacterized protein n=1 Tax=Cryptolaemus montrouzieri TaxID=559131 RepID=A0ABD2MRD5_9CUCU